MKYPSPADIAEMKARGYDRSVIEKAMEQSQRWEAAQAVCSVIRTAFKDVKLGNGVGLWQAQGIDDCDDEATWSAYREKDEKEDWQRITTDDLNHCYSSKSFFDAEGMRFHLPAYLIADLNGEYGFGMAFTLTHLNENEYCKSYFTLFSLAQRLAVREYLLYIRSEPDYSHERADIDKALEGYWTEVPLLVPWENA